MENKITDKGIHTGTVTAEQISGGITWDQTKTLPSLEEQIRKIVREEIAAHKEQPSKDPVYLSKEHERKCLMGLAKPI